MRLLIADCSVDYSGRLSAHLPKAKRLIMFKADGSVLIHSDGGSYKPLNWMMPPLSVEELDIDAEHEQAGVVQLLDVRSAKLMTPAHPYLPGICRRQRRARGRAWTD